MGLDSPVLYTYRTSMLMIIELGSKLKESLIYESRIIPF